MIRPLIRCNPVVVESAVGFSAVVRMPTVGKSNADAARGLALEAEFAKYVDPTARFVDGYGIVFETRRGTRFECDALVARAIKVLAV